jgi:hypothetical protein
VPRERFPAEQHPCTESDAPPHPSRRSRTTRTALASTKKAGVLNLRPAAAAAPPNGAKQQSARRARFRRGAGVPALVTTLVETRLCCRTGIFASAATVSESADQGNRTPGWPFSVCICTAERNRDRARRTSGARDRRTAECRVIASTRDADCRRLELWRRSLICTPPPESPTRRPRRFRS